MGTRTHGRGTFCISHILVLHPSGRVKHTFKSDPVRFINSDKESTQRKRRPLQPVPEKNIEATSAPNFANGSVGSAVQADQPQFAVHGELTLPKSKAEAGCRGEGEAKAKI